MTIQNLSRRDFIATSGTLVLGAALPIKASRPDALSKEVLAPNLFVALDTDGTVTVTSHRSEMGQGIRTAIAQIVADEMEADWSHVQVAQAQGDKAYGDQNTDGSQSIRLFLDKLRRAGATARQMLETAAANRWDVPASECEALNHFVKHKPSGRKLAYGELAAEASNLSVPRNVNLKAREDFRYIGKGMKHVDADAIAAGTATYAADVRLPGMAIAVIVRPPHLGSHVVSVKLHQNAKSQAGFIGLETLDPTPGAPLFFPLGGVAVIAETTYAAMQTAKQLDIAWSEPSDTPTTPSFNEKLRALVNSPSRPLFDSGDVDRVFETDGVTLEAVYETPFLSHAPMEPPCALADVRENHTEVWASVQDPQSTRNQVAGWLKTDSENVAINVTLLGGAFGRKSKPDFVLEAVELSRRLKRPIRVQWSREDDIQHDYYHAASAQLYRATLDDAGMPKAWLQRTAFPSITSTFVRGGNDPAGWELEMGFSNTPYRIPNQRFESKGLQPGVRIGWMRSVCNIFHAFSANVFVDELAATAAIDPIEYRLALIPESGILKVPGDQPPKGHGLDLARLRHVLERVRDLSEWPRHRPDGTGIGVAVHHSFRSYVATVIEAKVTGNNVKVQNAWVVLDCGTYVNSDSCIAQMEGAVAFGLSLAQTDGITMADGSVDQSNFHDYRVIRMNESPAISVELVASSAAPAGVGEPGVPPIAPALSNAIFNATGRRLRKLPLMLSS